jgi:hypothetical protein
MNKDLLILIVGSVLGISGLFFLSFLISWGWVYIWFYLLPFLLGSLIVGLVLKYSTTLWLDSEISKGSSKEHLTFNYKILALIYPALIFLVLTIFYFDPTSKVIEKVASEGKKGKQTTTTTESVVLEWPSVNKVFNDTKRSWYSDSFWSSIRHLGNEPEVFDRRNIGNTLFVSLFLGGPLFFFWLSRRDEFIEGERMTRNIYDRVEAGRQELKDSNSSLVRHIENIKREADERMANLRSQIVELEKENKVLKAKTEFVASVIPTKAQDKISEASTGLLDKDIL